MDYVLVVIAGVLVRTGRWVPVWGHPGINPLASLLFCSFAISPHPYKTSGFLAAANPAPVEFSSAALDEASSDVPIH